MFLTLEGSIKDDSECLYVVGLMASLTPYLLGDTEAAWEVRAKSFQARYRELLPEGLDPEVFRDRGAYGKYFAGQVAVPGGLLSFTGELHRHEPGSSPVNFTEFPRVHVPVNRQMTGPRLMPG